MWEKELQIARIAAESAGGVLVKKYGHVSKIEKKGEIDLVTEADIEAEKTIMEMIIRDFPGDSLIAEESGPKKEGPVFLKTYFLSGNKDFLRRLAGRIFNCSRYLAQVRRAIWICFSLRILTIFSSVKGYSGFSALINSSILQ